jgi:hypothetical protein
MREKVVLMEPIVKPVECKDCGWNEFKVDYLLNLDVVTVLGKTKIRLTCVSCGCVKEHLAF